MTDDLTEGAAPDSRRYRAPALDKGLDILELLAAAPQPLGVSAIVKALGRSTGELFRMIQVLEYRGFIEHPPGHDGYQLTNRLFRLSWDRPIVKTMVEVALPHMRKLAETIGQSCHVAVQSQGQIVVVARMESSADVGFVVRVGSRQPLPSTVSGLVLYACQSPETQASWEQTFQPPLSPDQLEIFRDHAAQARITGFAQAPSARVAGVIDTSAPILRGQTAVAALTIPSVHSIGSDLSPADIIEFLLEIAGVISDELHYSDSQV
jgi:DNA-binding IclR family transcriptional regulator